MTLTRDLDSTTAALDPLGADAVMRALPQANIAADTAWLRTRAEHLAQHATSIRDAAPARAALRDLGMITASLARHTGHRVPPPAVEAAMLHLGATADEVPRETVYSYATRNPRGLRRRSFTDTPGEHLFIDEVTAASHALEDAITRCSGLSAATDRNSADALAATVHERLRDFAAHLLTVKRTLTPQYFTGRLRPYYPPLDIARNTYYAPGGAQMPLLVLDVMILSQAATGELAAWYEQYLTDNTLYLPPHHRAVVDTARRSPGLARLAHSHPHLRPAAALLIDDLLRFRLPHRQLARDNMAVRDDTSLGSGGYTTSALDRLLEVTDRARTLLSPGSPMSPSIDTDFPPFPLGAPRSRLDLTPTKPPKPVTGHVRLAYPSRINAMALDSSKIVPSQGSYLAGELLFACDLMRHVDVEIVGDGPAVQTAPDCDHPVLARHAALLMRTALGTRERLRVRVSAPDLPAHLGLGSSSGQIAAVAAAVNELYGRPATARRLLKFLALNHGEEIDGEDSHLLPVQCLGGSAAAGLIPGAAQVVAGAQVPLLQAALPDDVHIVLGMPYDPVIWDARASLAAEARHFDAFAATGRTHGPEIAYRLLHDAWPSLTDGDLRPLGNLLFDYRFRMGSLANCAFSHPELLATGEKVEHIFTDHIAEVLTLSSVGPTFAALTRTPARCEQAFADAGLRTLRCRPWNDGYTLHRREEQ
ncbi:monodechloroaminopyrrolnitrin synthase PrnB family protein [Streptomyces lunaelactis]|uniref:monodechloroaminopyrrolnitrin synthase PrnB family protein n=1 Tax=Streptomyces lunaelactis TaxID=1535768 RepID=UPI001584E5BC|nr:monodechloroaminopyrrolnitrin synthase PrnB family protein [Streptomyces lunaelactis]NUK13974.1 DUF1864 family protein [Streptomyces lunaelactis]